MLADRLPAIYGRATEAMEVSSTSMNVGRTTEIAMSHGLICCSLLAVKFAFSLLLSCCVFDLRQGWYERVYIFRISIFVRVCRLPFLSGTHGLALFRRYTNRKTVPPEGN